MALIPDAGNNPTMLRLIALVVSIGIADSVNPTTIAPALYLAGDQNAKRKVIQFTVAVFAVYFLGGAAIALGPGQLVLALVPHPGHHLSYVLEVVAGVAMLTAAAFLWGYRDRLGGKQTMAEFRVDGRSSALLGATITAVELPTAFPYFAAIAAIVGSGYDILRQVFLLVLFNVCFILPLLGDHRDAPVRGPERHARAGGRSRAAGVQLADGARHARIGGRAVRHCARRDRTREPASQ